jgi:septal ring factor EnvC (AmiA/AmiB activator)
MGATQSAASSPLPLATPPPVSRTDLIFQRVAHASQLALVLLAIFGYFYTVLPVYQKSLLDEEIAKKTYELRAMESRVTETKALLASRSAEFNAMTNRVDELKNSADSARQRLARAQADVGKLHGTVDSQYAELRPRLLSDFQSLVLTECKTSKATDIVFADCVERKVLTSPVLTALVKADRIRLLRIVQTQSSVVESTKAEFWADNARKKKEVESQEKEAQARCEQSKNTDDYKDDMKKISIDYKCRIEENRIFSARLKINSTELFSNDKVLVPHLNVIAQQFFDERQTDR